MNASATVITNGLGANISALILPGFFGSSAVTPPVDSTAPVTSASPAAGTYYEAQSVVLSANEAATTYFTVDGSTPTIASSVYSGQIAVTQTTTIKYFSVDVAGNTESVKSATYTITTQPVLYGTTKVSTLNFVGSLVSHDIITKATELSGDDATRWPESRLLGYLSDGQAEVCNIHPQANVVTQELTLVAGSRQVLPDPCVLLNKVICNVNASGYPGPVPATMPYDVITTLLPDMHSSATAATVLIVGYAPQDPKSFFVYPPQPANTTQKLLASCVKQVAALASVDAVLSVGREYGPALVDYLLYRAYGEDTAAGSAEKSTRYLTDFNAKVQVAAPR